MSAMFPLFTCSSVRPAAPCHDFANSSGEYQMPPRISELTAQSRTATQLMLGMNSSPC